MSTVGAPGRVRHTDVKVRRLVHHPALAACAPRDLRRIAGVADETRLAAGDDLLTQGRICFWFFLIDSGTAAVIADGEVVGLLGPGTHVGEVAILGHRPSAVTVRAITDVTAYVVASQRFIPLVEDVRPLRRAFGHLRSRPRLAPLPWRPSKTNRRRSGGGLAVDALPVHHRVSRSRGAYVARAATLAAVIAGIAVVGTQYHPGPVVVTPGAAIDISDDITISGISAHGPHGRYILTPVEFHQPNGFGLVRALVHSHRQIIGVRGSQPSRAARQQARAAARATYRQSRLDAAAAAARAAGLPVHVIGTGARVTAVPAATVAGSLTVDDVIVAVDGRTVTVADGVRPLAAAHPAPAVVRVTFERRGHRYDTAAPAGSLLAIALTTRDRKVVLPFSISFKHHDLGGPSAGLIYALAIDDMLEGRDFAHGQTIAATGTIDDDGDIGMVGYAAMKAFAARSAHATVFLVPDSQCTAITAIPCYEDRDLVEALTRVRSARGLGLPAPSRIPSPTAQSR